MGIRSVALVFVFPVWLVAAMMPVPVFAAPPRPKVVTLTQPDGSKFQARAWGDENARGLETLDGYAILSDAQTGYWVYAVRSTAGTLTPAKGAGGSLVVGRSSPAGLGKYSRPSTPIRRSPVTVSSVRSSTGTQPVLVILVQFSDQSAVGTDAAYWSGLYFGSGNSIKTYFSQVSFDRLTLVPAAETYGTTNDGVVGWLTLAGDYATETSNDQHVADAITAAAPYVDFASFDTNEDGYVSTDELHIVVVAAGYELSYAPVSSCGNSIWAHADSIDDSTAPAVDGVKIADLAHDGSYTTVGEWHCDTTEGNSGHAATIGVPAHELGHDFGIPDLFDTTYATQGIGDWSLMGIGAWNSSGGGQPGNSPAHFDPWSRWYEGWITPTLVTGPLRTTTIPQIETSPTVFELRPNPNGVDWVPGTSYGTGEYFLVENRQLALFDAGLPGCGLLIWHIDESVGDNTNANHRFMDVEQADGLRQLNIGAGGNSGDAGDPYPGSTDNRNFDATSSPSSTLYSGSPSYAAITQISDCGSTMTAKLSYYPPPYMTFFPIIRKMFP